MNSCGFSYCDKYNISMLIMISLIVVVCYLYLLFKVVDDIDKQPYFYHANHDTWLFIVLFGSFIGILAYYVYEKKDK